MINKRNSRIKDFGGSGEVIILLHGFLASSKYWVKMQPYLSGAGYRVIAIDLLGFGNAPKPRSAKYDYADHVSYVDSIVCQLGINQPFVITGHSMGALIAARYSKVFPDKISSQILLHPPLYKDLVEARATLRNTGILYRFLLDSRYRRLGWMLVKVLAYYRIGKHSLTSREQSLRNVIEKAELFDDFKNTDTNTMLVVVLRDRAEYVTNVSNHSLSKSVTVLKADVTHHSPIQEPYLIQEKILHFIS
jgi:pimeloyl-ACP methyl ester carboxylesterase